MYLEETRAADHPDANLGSSPSAEPYRSGAVGFCLDVTVGDAVSWREASGMDNPVLEREFLLQRSGSVVPGVVWLPSRRQSHCPVVLLGHGGSGHKRSGRIVELGLWFASHAGLAAVAIDGPYHGDRVTSPLAPEEYQRRISEEGLDAVVERMVGDWRAAVEAVSTLERVDATSLGYLGLSMGTRFGLSFGAAVGTELRCAVLGKFGLESVEGFYENLDTTSRVKKDAGGLSATTLFHVQWDDELFPRNGQLALFDTLGTREKLLIAFPGLHAETHPMAPKMWCEFILKHLRPDLN
ncbi:MAG: hypothetical protein ABSG36_15215 [Acidimicrobiales bacterium]|jgi:dienelactone hydrolase